MIFDCSACKGQGVVLGQCLVPASHFQPAEYDDKVCPTCGGTGLDSTLRIDLHPFHADVVRILCDALRRTLAARRLTVRPYDVRAARESALQAAS